MRPIIAAIVAVVLSACGPVMEFRRMFTPSDFAHLRFLEGRWEGTGPDGAPFYEHYGFPSGTEMRSSRFADTGFTNAQDGSVIALEADGRVTATWNTFTWEASALVVGKACFVPVNAPSSFCWERLSDRSAQVTQRWTDAAGDPQQSVVPLRRL